MLVIEFQFFFVIMVKVAKSIFHDLKNQVVYQLFTLASLFSESSIQLSINQKIDLFIPEHCNGFDYLRHFVEFFHKKLSKFYN